MRLRTGSFYYRTAATLFVGTLASSIMLVGIGWLLVGKPMVQHSAMTFAKQIQNAADTYHLVREPQRPEFLAHLNRDQALTLEPTASSTLTGERPRLPYFIYLEEAISRVSGQPVTLLRRDGTYSFDFPTRDTRLRFHFNENRTGAAPILALYTMAVVALLSSLLIAVLIGKYTARPIETIAQRTETPHDSGRRVPIPEEGPRELREIVRNFNHITSQNRDLINNSSIMLAGISHDLRAPITRARMALELARDDMDESLALRIERALIQMDTLIAQYLDFTGGSLKEGASPLSIPALLKEILQTYKRSQIHLESRRKTWSICRRAPSSGVLRICWTTRSSTAPARLSTSNSGKLPCSRLVCIALAAPRRWSDCAADPAGSGSDLSMCGSARCREYTKPPPSDALVQALSASARAPCSISASVRARAYSLMVH